MKAAWIVYAIFAAIMAVSGLLSYLGAQSAPQQLAAAGFSLAGAAIPYLMLKGIQEAIQAQKAEAVAKEGSIREAAEANPPEAGAPDMERLRRAIARD
jgi:hypothetical protein